MVERSRLEYHNQGKRIGYESTHHQQSFRTFLTHPRLSQLNLLSLEQRFQMVFRSRWQTSFRSRSRFSGIRAMVCFERNSKALLVGSRSRYTNMRLSQAKRWPDYFRFWRRVVLPPTDYRKPYRPDRQSGPQFRSVSRIGITRSCGCKHWTTCGVVASGVSRVFRHMVRNPLYISRLCNCR